MSLGKKAKTLMISSEGSDFTKTKGDWRIEELSATVPSKVPLLAKGGYVIKIRDEEVIINEKAVIYINSYGDKFISKPHNEDFDEEKGLMMCLLKSKGVTHSQIKRFIEKCGVTKEKALMQEILYARYGIDNKDLKKILKNAKRQSHKEKSKEDNFVPLERLEIGKKYKITRRAYLHSDVRDSGFVTKIQDVVFTATYENVNRVHGYDILAKWCEEVKE